MEIEYFHASKYGHGAMVAEEFRRQIAARAVAVNVRHIREAKPKEVPPADQTNGVFPGMAMGLMGRSMSQVRLSGTSLSWEFIAWSQEISCPV